MKKLVVLFILFGLILNSNSQDSVFVYHNGGMIQIENLYGDSQFLTPGQVSMRFRGSDIYLKDNLTNFDYNIGTYDEIYTRDTFGFDSEIKAIEYLNSIINRALSDVMISDQVSAPVIVKMNTVESTAVIVTNTVIHSNILIVDDASLIPVGAYIGVFNTTNQRFYAGYVISKSVNTLTLDTPFDFEYQVGDIVGAGSSNMNVDGSVTPAVFAFRGADPGIKLTFDITRIILIMELTNTGDLSEFGNIVGGLTNGIVFRRVNGDIQNIFNAKTNADLSSYAFDFTFINAFGLAPDGIKCRLTFAGQNKLGVALRVEEGENLELLIQDDLTSLTKFEVILQGHVVED